MNRGKLDGNTLELVLYDKLKSHAFLVVKCENEIKQDYYPFCSGVDILCHDPVQSKSVFIQCKFAAKPTPVNDVNHFILSATCLQKDKVVADNSLLLWVAKVPPSVVGIDSLTHHGGEIITNDLLHALIAETEDRVLAYFDISLTKGGRFDADLADVFTTTPTQIQKSVCPSSAQVEYDAAVKVFNDTIRVVFNSEAIIYNICNNVASGKIKTAIKLLETTVRDLSYGDYNARAIKCGDDIVTGLPAKINALVQAYNKLYPKRSQLNLVDATIDNLYYLYADKKRNIHMFSNNYIAFNNIKTRAEFDTAINTCYNNIKDKMVNQKMELYKYVLT